MICFSNEEQNIQNKTQFQQATDKERILKVP